MARPPQGKWKGNPLVPVNGPLVQQRLEELGYSRLRLAEALKRRLGRRIPPQTLDRITRPPTRQDRHPETWVVEQPEWARAAQLAEVQAWTTWLEGLIGEVGEKQARDLLVQHARAIRERFSRDLRGALPVVAVPPPTHRSKRARLRRKTKRGRRTRARARG